VRWKLLAILPTRRASGRAPAREDLARERRSHGSREFFDGWFRDIGRPDGKADHANDYYDVMMLAPLGVNVATPAEARRRIANLKRLGGRPARWLQASGDADIRPRPPGMPGPG